MEISCHNNKKHTIKNKKVIICIAQFNKYLIMSFFKNNSPYIIAEIASAHEGNPDLAIELLNFASQEQC